MKLLVAIDGSEESNRALAAAVEIATATDGSITLIHAIEPDMYDAGGIEPVTATERRDRLIIDSLDSAEEHGQSIVDEAIASAEKSGAAVSGELRYGRPAQTITAFAEEGNFDAIYLGHRGGSERSIEFLGSVARDVVERASVPVTVVR